jgi:hypothetical protein
MRNFSAADVDEFIVSVRNDCLICRQGGFLVLTLRVGTRDTTFHVGANAGTTEPERGSEEEA